MPQKRHVRIEFDTEIDIDKPIEDKKTNFKMAFEGLRYASGSADITFEVCELSEDGEHCLKHITQGVHKKK